ncbi:MAG: glycosyltransferase [Candidatus Cloacimonetes bacterium]|nr:glycosyltransferase [Candidatus Cloacimonadota bacterium]
MKRLLHIQLLPLLSGVQRFSLYLLSGLDSNEFEIWVACKPGGEFEQAVKEYGFNYLPLPTFCHKISLWDLLTSLHLIWIMWRKKFDIVHTNSSKPGLLGRLAARICGVPLILHTAHGTAFQQDQTRPVHLFFSAMEFVSNLLGHKTIFVNNSDRLTCVAKHLLPAKKALTIYNAIPDKLSLDLTQIAQNRKPAIDELIIGSTIRFSTQKNAINLINVACDACKETPKLKFIILGDGQHYQLCKAIVETKGMSSRVILPGWDSNVIPWLKVFNAFVLYSRWEAQPFSIIEAMSSGLAVIGSRIPSIMELCDDYTGYLVDLDDHQTLKQVFINIAEDFVPVYKKGMAAAAHITALCNYQNMVDSYRDVYLGGKVERWKGETRFDD